MPSHIFPLVVGINDLLDASTVQILLLILSGLLGWLALRNRVRLKKIENDSLELHSQSDVKKAADERQEQLLNLMKGLLEQNSRQGEQTQKAFEQSGVSNDRWQKTIDTQIEATGNIAAMVKDFREFSSGQHKETREKADRLASDNRAAMDVATKSLELKVDAVRLEITTIRTDLAELPTIIDRKFKLVDDTLASVLKEIRRAAPSEGNLS